MIKMVITNLGLSKAPGPDYFLVVVLKNCEHVFSYMLDELFDMCLTESCFPDCFKVSLVVPVRMLGKGLLLKTTVLLVFLWLVKS